MKKIALLFLLCLSFSLTYAQGKKVALYKVGFYNLENLFDTINNNGKYDLEYSPQGDKQWNSQRYNLKQKNMAKVIKDMKVDILGVCEVENRSVLEDLVNMPDIADMGYKIVHYDSPDKRGVDVGLLYDPKKFRVLCSNSRTLTVEGKPDFKTRDQLVVTGLLAGEKVSIIVNHWPSRLGGEAQSSYLREAAAALSKSIADSCMLDDPETKVIIMGDMNDDPSNKSCRLVLGAKKKIKDVEKGGYFNTMWMHYDRGIGTLAYQAQWNLFDQIIISENMIKGDGATLKFSKSEVFNKDYLINQEGSYKGYPKRTFAGGVFLNGYSDHFPTIIYLTKEKK